MVGFSSAVRRSVCPALQGTEVFHPGEPCFPARFFGRIEKRCVGHWTDSIRSFFVLFFRHVVQPAYGAGCFPDLFQKNGIPGILCFARDGRGERSRQNTCVRGRPFAEEQIPVSGCAAEGW